LLERIMVLAYRIYSSGPLDFLALSAGGSDSRLLDWFGLWLLLISLAAFCSYALDKLAARSDLGRVPERRLLLLALAGGSPGAILAMYVFRHKIRKASFMIRFWLIVSFQAVAVGIWFAISRLT
jgi:uncharacterized membrane protein YsdA (DUF1294 family)